MHHHAKRPVQTRVLIRVWAVVMERVNHSALETVKVHVRDVRTHVLAVLINVKEVVQLLAEMIAVVHALVVVHSRALVVRMQLL